MDELTNTIQKLKKAKNAVILAHNYTLPEIQDIADFTGDSLELAFKARDAKADIIVFCGVRFMAETAKMLSPDCLVLLPAPDAGCPMADMAEAGAVRELKRRHPNAVTVCYVNSTAAVKAEVDICCTSANAEKIVASIPADREIIFLPDQNLGANVGAKLGRKLILWPGYCPTHHRIMPEMVDAARAAHPGAMVLVHPECPPAVVAKADFALSTGGILRHVRESAEKQFIIGTEAGIMHRLRKENPGKEFFLMNERLHCPNMKKLTLENLADALLYDQYPVEMDADLIARARRPIDRMLEMSK